MGEEDLRVGGARNAGGQRQHALCPAGTVKWHENSLVALVRRLSLDGDAQNGTGRVGQDFLSGAANPALAQLLPSAPSQPDQAIAPFADDAANLLCRLSFAEFDRGMGCWRPSTVGPYIPRPPCFPAPKVHTDRIGAN